MVSFKMFAGTHVGLRENNEDNFTVCPDLTCDVWTVPACHQDTIQLGERGCVMVVADGMGGQNAGEVASAMAIAVIQELFSPDRLPANIIEKPDSVKQFLKNAIQECDIRIKQKTREDAATLGMGSTIIIAWLLGERLYVAWLGDSRAYAIVPGKGIARLSRDHSYVQQLVDSGTISEEKAMSHPNSNIITRSLGDMSQKAKADVAVYDVEDGQIILLCTDGLCGVCRDEEIGGIVEAECNDLQQCKESLTAAALTAGGSDNITMALLQIAKQGDDASAQSGPKDSTSKKSASEKGWINIAAIVFAGVLLLTLLFAGYRMFFPFEPDVPEKSREEVNDSVKQKPSVTSEKDKDDTAKAPSPEESTLTSDGVNAQELKEEVKKRKVEQAVGGSTKNRNGGKPDGNPSRSTENQSGGNSDAGLSSSNGEGPSKITGPKEEKGKNNSKH